MFPGALVIVAAASVAIALTTDGGARQVALAALALAAGYAGGRASTSRPGRTRVERPLVRLASQLGHPLRRDPLTGLGNRHLLDSRLRDLAAFQAGDEHVLCYLDLDRFRVVNDISGHAAGDELLRRTAAALARTARRDDVVARIGADEFGVLVTRASLEQGEATAERLREVVGTIAFEWSNRSIPVSASVGVVPVVPGPADATHVLGAAESACRAAKEKGGNRVQPYRFEDSELAQRRDELARASLITRALDQGQFKLHYQPLRALNGSERRDHYELLVRMLDEDGETIAPGAFIPTAERYGLMPDVDRWVIASALEWLGRRTAAAGGRLAETWAINLSGTSLSDERLAGYVESELERHGVAPECVCFEITETAAIAHIATALALIAMLKRIGCRFALDDFGSGLSSFAYLRGLPVDYVKIDGTFVRDLPHDRVAVGVVEAINKVGHVVGARTVAEFVESEAALERLEDIGVDYAQGYAIAAPRDLDELPPPAVAAVS